MAEPGKGKRAKKPFDTSTPLNRESLRAWVEHFASQLAKNDTVEITLTEFEGDSRRTVSYESPDYNLCPMRHGDKAVPKPPVEPGGGGGS